MSKPVKIIQDRSRKSGHAHSKNIQDYGHPPVNAVALVTGNMQIARNLLTSNLRKFGQQLPVEMRLKLEMVVRNLGGV